MMKMRWLAVFTLILALTAGTQAYEKAVMVEYLSNTACGPCGAQDPQVQGFLNNTSRDEVVFMIYHVSWPSAQDWYYVRNVPQNSSRRNYYGVNSVPWFQVDGITGGNYLLNYQSFIEGRVGTYTPVGLTIDNAQINVDGQFEVTVTVATDQTLGSNDRLFVNLIDIDCAFGPAANGIDNYRFNMLQMAPSSSGQALDIQGGSSQTFTYTCDLWDTHEMDNYAVTAFVQNNLTDEIAQAVYSDEYSIPFPSLSVNDVTFDDDGQAMPNGRPDPGETVAIVVELENQEGFNATSGLVAELLLDVPGIEVVTGSVNWAPVEGGAVSSNAADPFIIEVSESFNPAYLDFVFQFSDDSEYEITHTELQLVGQPLLLVVNDHGNGDDAGDFWFDTLLESELTVEVMDAGLAMVSELGGYEAIVWTTSNATGEVINDSEATVIAGYLDQGGKLLLTGENIGETIGDNTLLADYFMAEHDLDAVPFQNAPMLLGVEDGPFPDAELIIFGAGGANTSEEPSSLTVLDGGVPLYHYVQTDYIGGVGYQNGVYSSIYLAFNLESATAQNNTDTFPEALTMLLQWMQVEADVDDIPGGEVSPLLPENLELNGYPNPFNNAMTVSYSLPQPAEVRLEVVNTLGRKVAELQRGRMQAGRHEVSFDGSGLASGVYLLALRAGNDVRMQKVVLMK